MNERRVLEVVLQEGAISRAQLARQTGLSKPTISQALIRLEDAGLLRSVGRTSGGRGATALLYDLDPRSGPVIAIDVGRRWARGVLVGRSEPTRSRGSEGLVQQLARIARELATEAGVELSQIRAITLGTPGVVRAEGDRMKLAPSLPGLQRHGALERLGAEFGGAPLRVENDVNLAALAELASGRGIDNDDFVFVSVGTGVGMALVLGGELRRGATGAAGEIGYLPLPDPATPSKGRGSFELTVAADAFLRRAQQHGLAGRTAEEVVDLARHGDRSARAVVHDEATLIGRGIAAVTAVVDPGLVVLGGGLGRGTSSATERAQHTGTRITGLHLAALLEAQ